MTKKTEKKRKLQPLAFVKNAAMKNNSAATDEKVLRKRIKAASKGIRSVIRQHLAA